ncbi:hypothetical protein [Nocardia sp. NBC_01388]|uniref:hypothetical protein n=1 Tax=Nocardia sp. NBC_01388 TaxID=2903596 RepID=UPI003247C89D
MPPTFTARDCIKAARSAAQNSCVRIGRREGWTVIWDDKLATPDADQAAMLPLDQLLMFTDDQFDAFQEALRDGSAEEGQCVQIDRSPTGRYTFTARLSTHLPGQQTALHFDFDEFEAFMDGVRNREFELNQFATVAQ